MPNILHKLSKEIKKQNGGTCSAYSDGFCGGATYPKKYYSGGKKSRKKGGADKINPPSTLKSAMNTYKKATNKLTNKVNSYQMGGEGGGSDWVQTQYAIGPINGPRQPEAQFRAFNKTTDYNKVNNLWYRSGDIDKALMNKPTTGFIVGDSLTERGSAEVYAPAQFGGKKKKSKKSKKKKSKKCHSRH